MVGVGCKAFPDRGVAGPLVTRGESRDIGLGGMEGNFIGCRQRGVEILVEAIGRDLDVPKFARPCLMAAVLQQFDGVWEVGGEEGEVRDVVNSMEQISS